jgi:hypothetical protein
MPFRKKNQLGFTSDDPFDRSPLCIKLRPGLKERLMTIPDWREKLREAIDGIVSTEFDGR